MTMPSNDMLVLVFCATGLVLLALAWLATRRMSALFRWPIRLVVALVAVAPLVLLLLPRSELGKSLPEPLRKTIEEAARRFPDVTASQPKQTEAPSPRAARPSDLEGAKAPSTEPPPPPARPEPSTADRPVPPPAAGRSAVRQPAAEDPWQIVPVFYGTDRARMPRVDRPGAPAGNAELRLDYGSRRAARLELGQALVTVPKVHQVPAIERPWVYKIPLTDVVIYAEAEDPAKHFTLRSVKALDREGFLALVRERLAASRDYEKHAVVFVHGYNTTFDYALYRTAQIAYDLGFDGAPFVYSWPSDGAILSYPYDRESAEQAQPYLKEFLELVTKETGATSVSIIAHSMGNSLLLPVLRELKRSAPPGVAISELILAAPDVGRDSFAFLAREIRGLAKGVTLYVSAADKALLASRRFWESPRAGEVPPGGPIVAEGIETIDITALSTDLFGLNHSGFAERTPLLADIRQLIRSGARPPESREGRMQKIESADGAFWRYTP